MARHRFNQASSTAPGGYSDKRVPAHELEKDDAVLAQFSGHSCEGCNTPLPKDGLCASCYASLKGLTQPVVRPQPGGASFSIASDRDVRAGDPSYLRPQGPVL